MSNFNIDFNNSHHIVIHAHSTLNSFRSGTLCLDNNILKVCDGTSLDNVHLQTHTSVILSNEMQEVLNWAFEKKQLEDRLMKNKDNPSVAILLEKQKQLDELLKFAIALVDGEEDTNAPN